MGLSRGRRRVAEPRVRGIATYELRVELPSILGCGSANTRRIYLDRNSYLPVRIADGCPAGYASITDYQGLVRLPLTPEDEKLLQMTPHPAPR